MTAGTLDVQYFAWLCGEIMDVRTRKGPRTYWKLLRRLFSTEFTWFVPNDDCRAEDGRELRDEWAALEDIHVDPEWATLGCSFFEMLIGLSRRLEFQTDRDTEYWFWHLIGNLGLLGHNDRSKFSEEDVDDRTSMVMYRTYDHCGNGGLFPLRAPSKDQRQVELWDQLNAYLLQDM